MFYMHTCIHVVYFTDTKFSQSYKMLWNRA
jgi:hypothetical protein